MGRRFFAQRAAVGGGCARPGGIGIPLGFRLGGWDLQQQGSRTRRHQSCWTFSQVEVSRFCPGGYGRKRLGMVYGQARIWRPCVAWRLVRLWGAFCSLFGPQRQPERPLAGLRFSGCEDFTPDPLYSLTPCRRRRRAISKRIAMSQLHFKCSDRCDSDVKGQGLRWHAENRPIRPKDSGRWQRIETQRMYTAETPLIFAAFEFVALLILFRLNRSHVLQIKCNRRQGLGSFHSPPTPRRWKPATA